MFRQEGVLLLYGHLPPLICCIMDRNYVGSPVFKGLQRPLEFMGIRGRFLTFAAMAIGFSFVAHQQFTILKQH